MALDWYTPAVKQFIRDHLHEDVSRLLLNPPVAYKSQIRLIVDQIVARQKSRKKLPLWYDDLELILPPPLSVEQASSFETANYKSDLLRGKTLIDLTGGMGVDTMAMSKHFEHTHYVEQQQALVEVFDHNQKQLHFNISSHHSTAEAFLTEADLNDATLYLDPARRHENQKIFKLEDCSPNLQELRPQLSKIERALIKLSPLLDIRSVIEAIPNVSEVHVVAFKNECKELLVMIEKNFSAEPSIICANLPETGRLIFRISEETHTPAHIGEMGAYLYEPNASIMKAGAFKTIAQFYDLKKLSVNTHLYTSDIFRNDFPGKVFEVLALNPGKKDIVAFSAKGHINVISRNHPDNATKIKQRHRLKDGGDYFLIAFRDANEKPMKVIGKLVTR